MNKLLRAAMTTALMAYSFHAFAAKPVSITFENESKAPDGSTYALYTVKCSDGQSQPMTAWDDRRTWCVGKMSKEDCDKRQIRAAKKACRH